MFHDVYRESPSESGFLGIGPDLYKLSESNFTGLVHYINEFKNKNNYVFTFDDGGAKMLLFIQKLLGQYYKKIRNAIL